MRHKQKPKYALVLVEWEDAGAEATHGWMAEEEALTVGGFPVQSVGFMIRKDGLHVSLVQCLAESGQVSNMTIIPRGCVKRIRKLNP